MVKKHDDQRMQKSRDDKQMKCKGGPDPEENNCDYKTEAKDTDDDEDTTNVIGVQLGPILVQLSSKTRQNVHTVKKNRKQRARRELKDMINDDLKNERY